MEAIARNQGVERRAEKTPRHLLYIPQIKETIPDALIIHIIRDGRDVAASMSRMRWGGAFRGTPHTDRWFADSIGNGSSKREGNMAGSSGLIISKYGMNDMAQHPEETLATLGNFVHADLDYHHIRQNAIGAVSKPNTSFKNEFYKGTFSPIGRRKNISDLNRRVWKDCWGHFSGSWAMRRKRRVRWTSQHGGSGLSTRSTVG